MEEVGKIQSSTPPRLALRSKPYTYYERKKREPILMKYACMSKMLPMEHAPCD
ncbi:hypothetical protein FHW16_004291 [Phyllobacterium myrsinacearum]|uniref:Uncharacterized protein n=1 Tax=Phyllobacterium myrsinacearum TaxID=28101 RepID=A0A839EQR3_9HYPH|nr:hypothetical protein [Phyllobacterium myrsinacearum]